MLAALMYGVGLSCSAASHLLGALGAEIGKTSVWRDAQEAGEALREKRPAGKARVLGADETVFKLKGKEVVVGFVVEGVSGKTLGFEVLFEGDGRAFNGSLLLMDIEVDPCACEHALKQRSQLFGRGQIGKRSPVSPEHYIRLQPPSHRPQRLRPG